MNIFGYPNLCHSVVPSPMQDMTGLIFRLTRTEKTVFGKYLENRAFEHVGCFISPI